MSKKAERVPYICNRRAFLGLSTAAAAGSLLSGCATNPVTGQTELMLMSESDEIQIDRQNAPYQFSADYGITHDAQLNGYINSIGQHMAAMSHRPQMPYSFQAVNAPYINAYAFPGGSIAVTRGILTTMENEAELAAVLGHELGHVNARHTAQQMSQKVLMAGLVAGATAVAADQNEDYAPMASALGGIGAGLLLARYSRNDERQADELGLRYMSQAGHNPRGMAGMMDKLRQMEQHQPGALEQMFATHPMSEERYQKALAQVNTEYAPFANRPLNRDRYMDQTANVRRIAGALKSMQQGNNAMRQENSNQAFQAYRQALRQAPSDYAALMLMAQCQVAMDKPLEAQRYLMQAKSVNPHEAGAYHLDGFINLRYNNFDLAHQNFSRCKQLLPGNPATTFLNGMALEGMGNRQAAAKEYVAFLQVEKEGDFALHAYNRLVEWGYINPYQ